MDQPRLMAETILKAFDDPDEVREFPLGRFEIVHVAGVTFGRATLSARLAMVGA